MFVGLFVNDIEILVSVDLYSRPSFDEHFVGLLSIFFSLSRQNDGFYAAMKMAPSAPRQASDSRVSRPKPFLSLQKLSLQLN